MEQMDAFIAAVTPVEIKKDESLSHYTFTQTGGPADILALPKTVAEVQKLVAAAKQFDLPITVIGNASNLIVRDGGIEGLVIILTEMTELQVSDNVITAQAGLGIIQTSEAAYRAGLTGLEFAAGIPGSVGGAVFMNAGAYGGEVSDVISSVLVLTLANEIQTLTPKMLDFRYRHSVLQTNGAIVLAASFTLRPGDASAIRQKMDELNAARAVKQPLEYPSCGSVFKRPEGYFVGPLIQEVGLQGYQVGGAQVSMKHAGFIVNVDHASATDYLAVIEHVQAVVKKRKGVILETEVRIIGRA